MCYQKALLIHFLSIIAAVVDDSQQQTNNAKQTSKSSIQDTYSNGHQGPALGANVCSTKIKNFVLSKNDVTVRI